LHAATVLHREVKKAKQAGVPIPEIATGKESRPTVSAAKAVKAETEKIVFPKPVPRNEGKDFADFLGDVEICVDRLIQDLYGRRNGPTLRCVH
jgi:hypothetical protein